MIKNIMILLLGTMIFLCACASNQAIGVKEPKSKELSRVEKLQQYKQLRNKSFFLSNYWIPLDNTRIQYDASIEGTENVLVIQAFTFAFNLDRNIDFVEFFIIQSDRIELLRLKTDYLPTIDELVAYGCDGCSGKNNREVVLDHKISDNELVFLKSNFRWEVLTLFDTYKSKYQRVGVDIEPQKIVSSEKEIFRRIIEIGDQEILIIYKISNIVGNGKWNKIFIGFKDIDCSFDNNGWYIRETVIDEQNKLLEKLQIKNSCEITSFNLETEFLAKVFCGRWYSPCAFPTDLISENSENGWRYFNKGDFFEIDFFGKNYNFLFFIKNHKVQSALCEKNIKK